MMLPIRLTLMQVWLLLVGLTVGGVLFAGGVSTHGAVIIAVFAAAIIKGHLVATHFMEVNRAAPHWRALYLSWILVIGVMLAVGSLLV
jgi:Prokaryotic Cytochrome C oxidase subunit IV